MKTYKAKTSVKRSIVKQFGTKVFEDGKVIPVGEEWGFEPGSPKEDIKEKPEPKKKRVYANSSSVGSPCQVVWTIAEEMGLEAKRKDVLKECEEQGVTFYTARTQYQKYKEALRGIIK